MLLENITDVPVLESNRLILNPLSVTYLSKKYVDWMNDKKVIRFIDSGGDYTLEKLKTYLLQLESAPKYFWAITLKSSGKHIGNIKIDPINPIGLIGEYGILIGDKNYWGLGLAKESSIEVINFCFKKLRLKKIELGVLNDNKKAISLYKKLGFSIIKNGNGKNCRMAIVNSI